MNLLWPLALAVARIFFGLYTLWCLLFPLLLMGLLVRLASQSQWPFAVGILLAMALAAIWGLRVVWLRRSADDPSPFQSALLSWFGTLKWFWMSRPGDMVKLALPSGFLVENPGGYALGGKDTRTVLNLLQPGDIMLRGYRGYIDGVMIRLASRCSARGFRPGWYTHAALYMGPLQAQDLTDAQFNNAAPPQPEASAAFQEGRQMVIHSMARGVHCEDVLTFLRCDYLAVLRLPATLDAAPPTQATPPIQPISVDRTQAVTAARTAALQALGSGYNFNADGAEQSGKPHHRFSCSELVHHCYASVQATLGLQPTRHALFLLPRLFSNFTLMARNTVAPDDFYELAQNGALVCVWEDAHSRTVHTDAAAPLLASPATPGAAS